VRSLLSTNNENSVERNRPTFYTPYFIMGIAMKKAVFLIPSSLRFLSTVLVY
jgi:hypothetical protein